MFFRGHLDKGGLGSCKVIDEVAALTLVSDGPEGLRVGSPSLWEDLIGSAEMPSYYFSGPLYKCSDSSHPILFVRMGNEVKVLTAGYLYVCDQLGYFKFMDPFYCSVPYSLQMARRYQNTHEYFIYKVPLSMLTTYATDVTHLFQSLRTVLRFSNGSIRSLGPEITIAPPYNGYGTTGCSSLMESLYYVTFTEINYPDISIPDNVEYIFDYVWISGNVYGDSPSPVTHDYLIYTLRDDENTITAHFASTANNSSPVTTYTSAPLLNVRGIYGYQGGITRQIRRVVVINSDEATISVQVYGAYSDLMFDCVYSRQSEADIFEKYRVVVGINTPNVFGFSFNLPEMPAVSMNVDSEVEIEFGFHFDLRYTEDGRPGTLTFPQNIVDGHPPLYIGEDGSIYFGFHEYITGRTDFPYDPKVQLLSDGTYRGVQALPGPSPAILTDDDCLVVAFHVVHNYVSHVRSSFYNTGSGGGPGGW